MLIVFRLSFFSRLYVKIKLSNTQRSLQCSKNGQTHIKYVLVLFTFKHISIQHAVLVSNKIWEPEVTDDVKLTPPVRITTRCRIIQRIHRSKESRIRISWPAIDKHRTRRFTFAHLFFKQWSDINHLHTANTQQWLDVLLRNKWRKLIDNWKIKIKTDIAGDWYRTEYASVKPDSPENCLLKWSQCKAQNHRHYYSHYYYAL